MAGDDECTGDITFEMLVRAFQKSEQRGSNFYEHRFAHYSALMRPYLNQPGPVMYAAYRLASNQACDIPLSPGDAEEAKQVLRQAGIPWEEHGS